MERIRKLYRYAKEKYELLHLKKYTTLAGTLVFFLVTSIVPLTFWLTLLIGKLPIDIERFINLTVFDSVKDVLHFVQKEALDATAGVSVVLLLTTLYSSTNLFYQMRRSGEIIYNVHRKRQGIKMRLGAFVLFLCIMLLALSFVLTSALGTFLLSRIISRFWSNVVDYVLLIVLAFLLTLLLNVYVCPYKIQIKNFFRGAAFTVAFWLISVIGFSIYLRFGNLGKLYGALSTIIVFLLWLYVLMIGFIVGVIFNSERITKDRKRKRANKKSLTTQTETNEK
ncbi:MAG: YihY/virulence factor BrkB family protein [Clostridia bacterium]|nr:YihY/virulence factor BrkB family protein [Clostridia bacterium]